MTYPGVKRHFCNEMGHYNGECPKRLSGNFTPRGVGQFTCKRQRSEDFESSSTPAQGGSGIGGTPKKNGRVEWGK